MTLLLFFIISYLVGSISPGYFLGKIVKKIDIRHFGNNNTGATNTYKIVGPAFGIIAGFFDFLKAAAVYLVAVIYFDISPNISITFGLTAVIGHIFPFYINFRGGRGMASLLGLILAIIFTHRTWFSLITVVCSLIYMAIIVHKINIGWSWRKILKLGAFILPFGFIEISSTFFLYLVGALFILAFGFDMCRFFSKSLNGWYMGKKRFSKIKETSRLSGYTLFLFSIFILFLFFSKPIILIALNLFIISDLLGPIAGQLFFRKEIINGKTWGGSIGIFAACIIAGLFMKVLPPFSVSWNSILLGAISTTVLDQLSFLLDDNLLVPLGTAMILTAII